MINQLVVFINKIGALLLILIMFPLPIRAENNAVPGFSSGQLLQNNPMLNVPQAPRSESSLQSKKKQNESSELSDIPLKKGPEIFISHIDVINSPESSRQDIQTLTAASEGMMMTLDELRAVAVNITLLLQNHGERLSYAYIPEQKITDGKVTINVLTGHLESVKLNKNNSLVKDSVVNKYIKKIVNDKSSAADIEKGLLAIADLPGVGEMSPFLSPGQYSAGTVLNVELDAAPRLNGVLVFDNTGSVTSGRNRIGTQLNINSPLGMGDRLQALAYFSPDFLQTNHDSKHGNTIISRVSYDAPLTTNSARAGISFSKVNYKLGGPVLHGLGEGYAEISSLYSNYALARSQGSNMTLGANIDFKRMNDKFWGEENSRTASVFSLQLFGRLSWTLLGKPNVVDYQLAYAAGRLNNDDAWNGLNTKGGFFKTNQSIKYQQSLQPGIAFNLSLNGQQASKNLDGAEKMPLGGPYAVRAYSNSVASADSAWLISPSLSFYVPGFEKMTAEIFYDYASGKIQKFSRRSTQVNLRGYGIGVNYDMTPSLFANLSYAWRDGQDELLPLQNKAMGWITAGFRF